MIARLHDVLETGNYTSGKYTKALEDSVKEHFDLQGHVVAVSSCTSGLILVLNQLMFRPLIPDFTFSATAHAAFMACNGFRAGDCSLDSFNLQIQSTNDLDGVVATHIFGNPADIDVILEAAQPENLPVVFDAAHALRSMFKGKSVLDYGTASVVSCSPSKPLTCGEGGLIITRDAYLAEKLRQARNYGNIENYDCVKPGMNARMSEFQAIIGLASLQDFDRNFSKRMSLVQEYQSYFPEEICQKVNPEGRSSWKDFSVKVGAKLECVSKALSEAQIEFKRYFRPVSSLTCYSGWLSPQRNASLLHGTQGLIQLPLHCQLDEDDIGRISKIVLESMGDTLGREGVSVHELASTAQNGDSRSVVTKGVGQ